MEAVSQVQGEKIVLLFPGFVIFAHSKDLSKNDALWLVLFSNQKVILLMDSQL